MTPSDGCPSPTVTVVVLDGDEARANDAARSLGDTAAFIRAEDLRAGLTQALGEATSWIWLLDGSAAPEPAALDRLLEAAGHIRATIAPALLASKVVDQTGALVLGQAPWPRRGQDNVAMAAFANRMLSIRAARGGSLLISRAIAAAHGLPTAAQPPGTAVFEWTARILRHRRGFLVPASRALADAPSVRREQAFSDDPIEDVRARSAVLRGTAWEPKERLWLSAQLAGTATALVARGEASAPALLGALVGGLGTGPI